MSRLIAVTGKGGVGKTTLAALMVLRLIQQGHRPVLAVDADPNACLDSALGVQVLKTVGGVREDARSFAQEGRVKGMDKQRFLQFQIAESLVEDRDFDLIAMGRSEGPGCYCYANNILKEVLREMVGRYPWVVLDNEAGLENLSRRLVNQVDLLVIVTDPSARGILTVRRLHALAREMGIVYARLVIVVNRLRRPSLPDGMDSLKIELAAHKVVGLIDDEALYGIAEGTGNLRELPMDNPLWDSVDAVLEEIV